MCLVNLDQIKLNQLSDQMWMQRASCIGACLWFQLLWEAEGRGMPRPAEATEWQPPNNVYFQSKFYKHRDFKTENCNFKLYHHKRKQDWLHCFRGLITTGRHLNDTQWWRREDFQRAPLLVHEKMRKVLISYWRFQQSHDYDVFVQFLHYWWRLCVSR